MAKKKEKEDIESTVVVEIKKDYSKKENLLELYQTLKDLKINSISNLEELIAHAE